MKAFDDLSNKNCSFEGNFEFQGKEVKKYLTYKGSLMWEIIIKEC
jgi:hypothetical protein